MFNKIGNHIFKMFSGKDNETLDLGRILWAIGVIIFYALSILTVINGTEFTFIDWGLGLGSVLALGGVALKFKEKTEPDPRGDVYGPHANRHHAEDIYRQREMNDRYSRERDMYGGSYGYGSYGGSSYGGYDYPREYDRDTRRYY